jgi:predicted glycogen debranching enzyme
MEQLFTHRATEPLTDDDLIRLNYTEWLVTNGLGGYATGTLGGTLTRVFHGYLIAVLPSPLGRTMMLNDVFETVLGEDGQEYRLNNVQTETNNYAGAMQFLTGFRLDSGLPVWTYEVAGITIEKRVYLPNRQNTTYINYRVKNGTNRVRLVLRPAVNMRGHEAPVNSPLGTYTLAVREHQYELQAPMDIPPLRLKLIAHQPAFSFDCKTISDIIYNIERSRGYTWRGDLWSPGCFSAELGVREDVTLTASTESWNVMSALSPHEAWDAEHDRKGRLLLESHPATCEESCRELVWAADQFVFAPVGRQQDTARARAAGVEFRSLLGGYQWFTFWGRVSMICLEVLTITAGRPGQAWYILRTLAHYLRAGLLPNMFP